MSDLSPETRSLLDQARDGDAIPPGRRDRLEARLFTRIVAGTALALTARHAWASSAGLFGPVAKGVASLALVSAMGGAGYFATRVHHSAPVTKTTSEAARAVNAPSVVTPPSEPLVPAPSRAPRVAALTGESPRRVSASMEARETPTSRKISPSRPTAVAIVETPSSAPIATSEPAAPPVEEAAPVRAPSTLAEETRLLWEADQAIRAGNTGRALSLLDDHASRYPDGALGPERTAERVVALCKAGRVDAAVVRTYLASHPSSSINERIQQTCARILGRAK